MPVLTGNQGRLPTAEDGPTVEDAEMPEKAISRTKGPSWRSTGPCSYLDAGTQSLEVRGYGPRMRPAGWFAERSARGMLTRAVGAWILIGLPIVAARIWWSVPAALTIFIVGVTIYVTAAVRYMRHHRRPEP